MATRGLALPPYSNEAYAIFAQATTPPDATRKGVIDTLIKSLQSANVWNKFDLFYVLAAADSQVARLNWVFPGRNTLSAVNSPTFTADQGYTGDGSTSYLDSLLAHSSSVRLTQNSAHIGCWGLTAGASARSIAGATTTKIRVRTNTGAGANTLINSTAGINISDGLTVGHVVGTRRDASNHFVYRNGGTETTAASASVATDATTLTFGKDSGSFSSSQILAGHTGSQLSAADVLAIYNALLAYKTSVGA